MKLITAALLFLLVSVSPPVEEEKIPWKEDRKLTWADFKGTPSGSEEFVASTNSGVTYSFSYSERNGVPKVEYKILSNFYPNLSWYRPAKVSDYILGHEQLHFDISELHARKLKKALSELPHNREFGDKSKVIYEQMEAERRAMQNQYDSDSDHSNIETEEFRWRKYVAEQLDVYDDWK
ncbi:DUF922 domain-containing protein [Aureisphaera galaxeae]|uniref:DUF922 domain-containing protein n=1 Tax=Aureisphaera galaxeae TaxID=1538023 RepID=UPI00234FE0CA|nr:DUF922 domain-containing protein [Aureisphaera galaxeae]MDC8003385.1 DUF922 domain-containing protein [Aureisphaera galaxeae]